MLNIVGGIAVGLVVGYVIRRIRRPLDNPPLEVTIAFLTGYFAFLPASALGVSGVLAVVTAGIYMGWYTPELTTVQTRLRARGSGRSLAFLLNVLLFGLVGLQLRPILDDLSGHGGWSLVGRGGADRAGGDRAPHRLGLSRRLRAAMALPRASASAIRRRRGGTPRSSPGTACAERSRSPRHCSSRSRRTPARRFPAATSIVFFAFAVVLGTLVVQGLSMPAVIRVLGLEADDGDAEAEEALARIRAPRRPSSGWRSWRARTGSSTTRPSGSAASTASGSTASPRASTRTGTARSRSAR